ncbi:hypothetical protein [Saccharopolyspora tripterygii]
MSPGGGVNVALEALNSDAKTWESAAQGLSEPMEALGSLDVELADVSIFAQWAGLDNSFNQATSALEEVIKKASEYFQKISSDLGEAAKQYQADDERGMHEVQGAYRMQGDLYGG